MKQTLNLIKRKKIPFVLSTLGLTLGFKTYNEEEKPLLDRLQRKNKEFEDGSQFYIPPAEDSKMKVFSGNGNWYLANEISMHLGTQLGRATVNRFADGEVNVNIHDNVRGKDVFVIQPLGPPVNENLMELLLIITTLRRASARKVTAVIPYFGYGRSTQNLLGETTNKKESFATPIGAADVASMLEVAGADRIVAIDLHSAQIQGFFGPDTPVDNLDVSGIAIPYFETKGLKDPVVVSPDANGAPRAKSFRDKLIKHGYNANLAVIVDQQQNPWKRDSVPVNSPIKEKEEQKLNYEDLELVGDVKGCDVVIFDDMISSGRSMAKCAKKLEEAGARRIFAFATHGEAYDRISKSSILEVVCVNTLPLKMTSRAGINSFDYSNKVHQLSVAALLAEAIRRIQNKQSLAKLFDE
eukprot:snap_masked-scaffold_23-processed-gene-1.30-mRNA-1 protein AED:0.45 eAED:0.45 QI:0/0/0/1/1/1/2/0/410